MISTPLEAIILETRTRRRRAEPRRSVFRGVFCAGAREGSRRTNGRVGRKIKKPGSPLGRNRALERNGLEPITPAGAGLGSTFVGEQEVVKADLLGDASGRGEQVDEQFAEMIGADAVEVVLAFSA